MQCLDVDLSGKAVTRVHGMTSQSWCLYVQLSSRRNIAGWKCVQPSGTSGTQRVQVKTFGSSCIRKSSATRRGVIVRASQSSYNCYNTLKANNPFQASCQKMRKILSGLSWTCTCYINETKRFEVCVGLNQWIESNCRPRPGFDISWSHSFPFPSSNQ